MTQKEPYIRRIVSFIIYWQIIIYVVKILLCKFRVQWWDLLNARGCGLISAGEIEILHASKYRPDTPHAYSLFRK